MHRGDLVVTESGRCDLMVGGNVHIARGVWCEIAGIVARDVLVAPGGQVEVTGMVAGEIIRQG